MSFRPIIAVCLFFSTLFLPAVAQARDFCVEAWVLRNMIFDRLGYCFGSVAGKTLFDNSDCTGKNVKLGPQQADTVAFIKEGEAHVGCKINTSRPPSQGMRDIHARYSRFSDLPAPDYVGGFACWGYRGPAFQLRSGASASAPVIGTAQPGQSVVSTYYTYYPGWHFYDIVTGPSGDHIVSGWANQLLPDMVCDREAG